MHPRLKDRLGRLEEKSALLASGARTSMDGTNLMVLLIAGHLGGMTEREAVMSAYGRALGYDTPGLRAALGADPGTLDQVERNRRHGDAVDRLLAMKGAGIDGDEGYTCDALRALFEDLPEHVRQHPFGRQVGANLNEAMDMCL